MTAVAPEPRAHLEVLGVGKSFGARATLARVTRRAAPTVALDDVSLSVRRGGSVGIVGESGSGKTTLVRIVMGLQRPDRGRVLFDGVETQDLKLRDWQPLRRRMQLVYQDPYSSLNPGMTVGQAIAEPIVVHGLAAKDEAVVRAGELMEQVGLSAALARRRPRELSGGQRQRVAIARALALGPELLIADEAVSALDVSVQAQVLRLFAQLRADLGLTLLFVSHQLATVAQICDEVVIMRRGEIVERGATQAVFEQPSHPYTRSLLESHPHLA